MGQDTANGWFYKPVAKERGYSEKFNSKLDNTDAFLAALSLDQNASARSLPRNLPNLIGWWDPSTLSGADDSLVSVLKDSSGFGQDLVQSTTAARPTLKLAAQAGRNVLRFYGSSYLARPQFGLANSSDFGQPASGYSQPNTIVLLAKVNSYSSGQNVWVGTAASTTRQNLLITSATPAAWTISAGSTPAGPAADVRDDAWHVITAVFDTASTSIYIDGFLAYVLTSQAHGAEPLGGLSLGADSAGANRVMGDAGDLMWFNARLSPQQILSITKYLNTKWNLSLNMPTSQDGSGPIDTTVNGQAVRLWLPPGSAATPLIIMNHGALAVPSNSVPGQVTYEYIRAYVSEGWIVAMSALHGDNWGNNNAIADLQDLYTAVSGMRPVSAVLLHGVSMGGLPSALAIPLSTVPNIKGVLSEDGVLSLANMHTTSYRGSIETAYGITSGTLSSAMGSTGSTSVPTTASFPTVGTQLLIGNGTANAEIVTTTGASTGTSVAVTATTKTHASGDQVSDYPTKTAGHDPALRSGSDFTRVPWHFYASSNDGVVAKAANVDVFSPQISAAAESTVLDHKLPHLDLGSKRPNDAVAFFRRCLGIVSADASYAPKNLAVSMNSTTSVTLTWTPSGPTGTVYTVTGTGLATATTTSTTITFTGLAIGQAYTFQVTASNGTITSPPSAAVTIYGGQPNQGWWKASAIQGLPDGSNVSLWPDLSGKKRTLSQATSLNQPIIKTSVLNGKPVVRFNSGTATQVLATSVQDIAVGSAFSIILVFQMTGGAGTARKMLTALNSDHGPSLFVHSTNHVLYTREQQGLGLETNFIPALNTWYG